MPPGPALYPFGAGFLMYRYGCALVAYIRQWAGRLGVCCSCGVDADGDEYMGVGWDDDFRDDYAEGY